MKKRIYFNFFFFLFFTLSIFSGVGFVSAEDLTSASFIVRDPVIGAGGGYASSGTFKLFQSLDPVLIGVGSSLGYIGHYGFLYFEAGSSPTPTPTPTPSGGGGGAGVINIRGCSRIADFNCDGAVDILDLSILLFYTGKTGTRIIPFDLSNDGQIDLKDISIMFYYWDNVIS